MVQIRNQIERANYINDTKYFPIYSVTLCYRFHMYSYPEGILVSFQAKSFY